MLIYICIYILLSRLSLGNIYIMISSKIGNILTSMTRWERISPNHFILFLLLVLSIPVLPKLWDTELICTEYAQNYWLTRVPVDLSPRRLSVNRHWNYLARVLFDLSPRHLSVDWCQNYSGRVIVNSNPRCLSVDRCWNYLGRVPAVWPSTNAENFDSHPSRLSFDRHNLQLITS